MTFLKNKNFAKSVLISGISSGDLTLTINSSDVSKFPAVGSFRVVVWGASFNNPSDDSNREVLTVTFVSSNVFTILRAQEGTVANNWNVSDKVSHVLTAGKIDELETEINKKSQLTWDTAYTTYLIDNP